MWPSLESGPKKSEGRVKPKQGEGGGGIVGLQE